MKISYKHLGKLVNLSDIDYNTFIEKQVSIGNEAETVKKTCISTNLIIGKVVEVKKHQDSDHLNVCQVDIGQEILQIVCGANNVRDNIKVIIALPGSVLKSEFTIKKSTIRGETSNGMICALSEIIDTNTKDDGIYILNDDAIVGNDPIEYLGLDDIVIDFDLTSNRGDLLSYIGFAYETAALLNRKINIDKKTPKSNVDNIKTMLKITNNTDKCMFYNTKIVKNIVIKESPEFIKTMLLSNNIKPINNVVDISNYVMLLYGQPLHFFDYQKLGNEIIIRCATEDETTFTLDQIERKLNTDDIVICNTSEIVAVAGVMGSMNTMIDDNTKDVVIECAIFDPYSIRKTSKKVYRSEASIRFEKGIDVNRSIEALNLAAYLLETYATGEVIEGILGFNNINSSDKLINISVEKINNILGMDLTVKQIDDVFIRLGFKTEINNNIFNVYVPYRRLDINIKEDLIEEVGRFIGYDNMVGIMPISRIKEGTLSNTTRYIRNIKDRLNSLGLDEVITYSLTDTGSDSLYSDKSKYIYIKNKISEDKEIMRTTLIPSLLKVANYNKDRKNENINIFETSTTYYYENDEIKEEYLLSSLLSGNFSSKTWNKAKINNDFYTLKGILENLLIYLGFNNRISFNTDNLPKHLHPYRSANVLIDNKKVGYIGQISSKFVIEEIYILEISINKLISYKTKETINKEISKYPSINKDFAFILNKNITSADVVKSIKKIGGKLLEEVKIFDVYNIDDENVSIAFSLTFTDYSKTLSTDIINPIFDEMIDKIQKEFNGQLRNI